MGMREPMPHPGVLIAFCGIDGSGKSTQVRLAAEWLAVSEKVTVLRPNTEWYRRQDPVIRSYMDGSMSPEQRHDMVAELALFSAADRYRQTRTEVLPRLAAGEIVLMDRYVHTSWTWAIARGLDDAAWLAELNRYFPPADLTMCFDVDVSTARQRILARGELPRWEEQDTERMRRVRQAFLDQPWGTSDTYHILDAEQPADDLAIIVRKLVGQTLRSRDHGR
ncbi:dTMP kinase [Fodinicola acaciae]|uniref:dTMP kinase n=1 Tax=Fodinicola acaciae TaxID=2681555 RepID=UPI0013D13BDC|nr:dTMP kinase [Fodinicola acaciae]